MGGVAGVAGCVAGVASPWASVACLCIGFEGWLFGGLTLLGPPAISFSEAFFVPMIDLVVDTKLHGICCPPQVVVVTDNAFRVDDHAGW